MNAKKRNVRRSIPCAELSNGAKPSQPTPVVDGARQPRPRRSWLRRINMYIPENASNARVREAEHARHNRSEILKALSHGQVSRRDLMRMGLMTAAGSLGLTNGLSI